MSLGTLTKGPVGSVIPCLVAGVFLLLRGINFYLGDRISSFYKRRPAEGFLLTGDEDAAKYFPQFESKGYTFKERYVAPRPVLGQQARV